MENVKRLNWPLARVVSLFPGADGITRVARVKVPNSGELTRPLQRLVRLELDDHTELVSNQGNSEADPEPSLVEEPGERQYKSRYGRVVTKPVRF